MITMNDLALLLENAAGSHDDPATDEALMLGLIRRAGELTGRPVEGSITEARQADRLWALCKDVLAAVPLDRAGQLLRSPEVAAVRDAIEIDTDSAVLRELDRDPEAADRRLWESPGDHWGYAGDGQLTPWEQEVQRVERLRLADPEARRVWFEVKWVPSPCYGQLDGGGTSRERRAGPPLG